MKQAKATEEDIQTLIEFFESLESATTGPQLTGRVIKQRSRVTVSWRRVVYGCQTLIKTCCDPSADTLEWRPDLKPLVEAMNAEKAAAEKSKVSVSAQVENDCVRIASIRDNVLAGEPIEASEAIGVVRLLHAIAKNLRECIARNHQPDEHAAQAAIANMRCLEAATRTP